MGMLQMELLRCNIFLSDKANDNKSDMLEKSDSYMKYHPRKLVHAGEEDEER